jgi:PBP1b-binding outer membrane lipoprotein LpoB
MKKGLVYLILVASLALMVGCAKQEAPAPEAQPAVEAPAADTTAPAADTTAPAADTAAPAAAAPATK